MKRILLLSLMIASINFYSQEKPVQDFKKNEIKINALLLVVGSPEITYERLLNDESGIGLSIVFDATGDFETKFMLSPYYRFYFGKKPAAGFFIEGFASVNTIKIEDDYYYTYDPVTGQSLYYPSETYTDFALGFGVGAKWLTKRGLLFELSSGFGRNLLNADKNEFYGHTFVGRGGIIVGYRF